MPLFIYIIRGTIDYFLGNILALFLYKKKYITGKYFRESRLGFLKIGWGWVVSDFFARSFLRINNGVPFPISPRNHVNTPENIHFNPDDLLIFQGQGKYFQAVGATITIGKGCYIADNVGIITANHSLKDLKRHEKGQSITLGENCWIGMNSVILPGVKLGDNTVVGAGSVVTKSFPEGNCIVAGNPAKIIKILNKNMEVNNGNYSGN
ncbi:acyltransferase [Facklamia sp. DSM 111018]|uniref:Acyltransferase n=1 Tax=Facklamia lactis TaxID=2749967 RepID=A0ABS0LMI4_9LACT|nr:DapH/DapD/GlmU-related protein [Facklamia lactis]MBG9979950.1 acyltransferase [Facklamia lactis]MBG9985370.1 acyltransferase [Facklamia lactis]